MYQQNNGLIAFDPVGAIQQGQRAGAEANVFRRQNALAKYERENADDIVAGGPVAAANYLRAGAPVQNALAIRTLGQKPPESREDLTKRVGVIAQALRGIDRTPEAFQQTEDRLYADGYLTDEEYRRYTFDDLDYLLSKADEFDQLSLGDRYQNVPGVGLVDLAGEGGPSVSIAQPEKAVRPPAPDEYQRYVQEERAAGRQVLSRIDYAKAKRSKGLTVYDPETGRPLVSTGEGGQEFGRKTTNDLQAKYADSYDLSSRLDRIGEIAQINPATGRMSEDAARMLTYRGQGEDWLATVAEKAGIEPARAQRDAIELRTKFTTAVEQLFNAYRKEITGAAAAVQELDRLKKSFINTDMSPTQFEAAYGEYRGELQRAMRISRKLLREGVDPKSKEGGDIMDRLYLGGADDDAGTRFDELAKGGMGEAEIYEKMASEGYQ